MKRNLNLMSDQARFFVSAKTRTRGWAAAAGVLSVALVPIAVMRWQACREIRATHEALEARYEPIRQLTMVNRTLSASAAELVAAERVPLQLARRPSIISLLGLTGRAASHSQGELFIEQVSLTPSDPGGTSTPNHGRVVVEAASTLTYDVSRFVEEMQKSAFSSVKIVKSEVVSQDGVDRRRYTVECDF